MSEVDDIRPDEHERLRDDLAAYALDALGGDEAVALERHLEDCETCRARLRWLRPAIDVLPASVAQRTPPARLRENLLRTVRAEAAEARAARGDLAGRPSYDTAAKPSWWRRLQGTALRPATGLAAVVLIGCGVGAGYLAWGHEDDPEPQIVKAEPSSGLERAASATLVREEGAATLHVNQLPRIDRDEVYEVWVQRAGVIEPANTFVLNREGGGEVAVPGSLEGAEAVLVTREPRPGSTRPTGPPLLEAPLK